MQSVAPVAAKAARLSPSGMAEARTAVRVRTTDWATPGSVSSLAQCGGRGGEGRHAGRDRPRYAQGVEPADLLGDGPVERGVARMHPGDVVPGLMRGLSISAMICVQRHRCRVDHPSARRRLGHDLARHQRAGIEADRAAPDEVAARAP